jgi:hypothetical protein
MKEPQIVLLIEEIKSEVNRYYSVSIDEIIKSKPRNELMLIPFYISVMIASELTGLKEGIMRHFSRNPKSFYHISREMSDYKNSSPSIDRDFKKLKNICAPDDYVNFEDEFESAINYQFPVKGHKWVGRKSENV